MKINLLFVFFLTASLLFSQSEREIIDRIDAINSKALAYYDNNKIVDAFNAFGIANRISDSINDSYGSAVANFNLGRIYGYMQEYEDAEKCFSKMLKSSLEIDDNYLIANSYLGLAELYEKRNQFQKVLDYYQKALDYALKNEVRDIENLDKQNSILFSIRMNLSEVYLKKGEFDTALIYLLRAKKNLETLSMDSVKMARFDYLYGRYFMNKEFYLKANERFRSALMVLQNGNDSKLNVNLLYCEIYKDMSKTFAILDDNQMAYNTLLMHNKHRELFMNEEKIKQENIAKSKFYLAEYKQIAERANKERILQEQITQKVKKVSVIIIFTSVILCISLLMLYRNYRSKRKLSYILKEQNQKLEYAKDQAEKSSQLKTKFISNVSHELRTPLYGVVGLTSLLLKRNDLSERDSKYLKSLKYSGDYLLNLVNDILHIGKMESENVELKLASTNIRELIQNVIDSFQYKLQETNNKIEVDIDQGIPKFIKCDNIRLSQILINLIGNSIKFTENETTTVQLKLLGQDSENVNLQFVIKDNGPGIPKDKHESIFENFSQLDKDSNVNYKGTGLGLPITKKLVELFGSSIELESDLGKGSTFSFTVSFEQVKAIEMLTNEVSKKPLQIDGSYRILVAEDNRINQIVTQNILEKKNFQCAIAKNGLEAVNMFKEDNYDLILMDINMPVMDGNEATREIRKINSSIPIIALTAADIEEVRNDCVSIGYNGVITKPFDDNHFYQTIISNIYESKKKLDNNFSEFKAS